MGQPSQFPPCVGAATEINCIIRNANKKDGERFSCCQAQKNKLQSKSERHWQMSLPRNMEKVFQKKIKSVIAGNNNDYVLKAKSLYDGLDD